MTCDDALLSLPCMVRGSVIPKQEYSCENNVRLRVYLWIVCTDFLRLPAADFYRGVSGGGFFLAAAKTAAGRWLKRGMKRRRRWLSDGGGLWRVDWAAGFS